MSRADRIFRAILRLRYALRDLRRNPTFTIVAVLALATPRFRTVAPRAHAGDSQAETARERSLAPARVLSSMLFATSERDPVIFVAVAPAIRAARVDPAIALRKE